MANPTTEGNGLLDTKRSCQLFQAASFRTISERGEVSLTSAQQGRSRPQRQIASLARYQPADEDQLKLGTRLRKTRIFRTQRPTDAGLGNKKELVAMPNKLGIGLGRSGYDRCCVTVGGSSKRQDSV